MQNAIDKHHQRRRFEKKPVHPATIIAKCLAGILILIGILLIGVYAPEGDDETRANFSVAGVPSEKSTGTDVSRQKPAVPISNSN